MDSKSKPHKSRIFIFFSYGLRRPLEITQPSGLLPSMGVSELVCKCEIKYIRSARGTMSARYNAGECPPFKLPVRPLECKCCRIIEFPEIARPGECIL